MLTGPWVTVEKGGQRTNIDVEALRPGDVVVVQSGEIVPADLQLLESRALEVDEFELTGEISPVVKQAEDPEPRLLAGSRVLRGTGKGVVIAAGEATEWGRILKQETRLKEPEPLHIFRWRYFLVLTLLLPALVLQILRRSWTPADLIFLLLAPWLILLQNDGLFRRLLLDGQLRWYLWQGISVRDRTVLERLARVDTVCLDKTGVLTTRQMKVKCLYLPGGIVDCGRLPAEARSARLIKTACALCNDVAVMEKVELADPLDRALISFAEAEGFDFHKARTQYRRFYDQPFDPERRYMACGFEASGSQVFFAKGAPEVIARMCADYLTATGCEAPIDPGFRHQNEADLRVLQGHGNPLIALAYTSESVDGHPGRYTFLGLVQLENPLQPAAYTVVRELAGHGVRSLLLTGDRPETAIYVAEASGLTQERPVCLTGTSLAKMEAAEVGRQAGYCSVFARLLPSQKGLLVNLLRAQGQTVAMVGDGPNDGIAMQAADVGISFRKDSSPLARRFAGVLLDSLADLPVLLAGAKRLQLSIRLSRVGRWLLLAASLAGPYLWLLTG